MCISDETFDKVREAWAASIPEQYRFNEKTVRKDRMGRGVQSEATRHLSSSIILPPPPKPLLDSFFASIRMHLTADQLKARPKYEMNKPEPPPPSKRLRHGLTEREFRKIMAEINAMCEKPLVPAMASGAAIVLSASEAQAQHPSAFRGAENQADFFGPIRTPG